MKTKIMIVVIRQTIEKDCISTTRRILGDKKLWKVIQEDVLDDFRLKLESEK